MFTEITSLQNQKIKNILTLQKARERKKQNRFIIEGIREVSLAQQSGFTILSLFISKEIYSEDLNYPIDGSEIEEKYHISKQIFEKIAYRETTGGVIAVAENKVHSLINLPEAANPVYLALEKVEKPGNIGAILRTADAAGISGVIICDPATDFYNPNVIRSSVGCLFTVPIASSTNEELYSWLKEKHILTYATMLTATNKYHKFDYQQPTAFLLGSESNGLSEFWEINSDEKIIIPMHGKIDSMNVSNAASIVIYEAIRQRDLS